MMNQQKLSLAKIHEKASFLVMSNFIKKRNTLKLYIKLENETETPDQ